MARCAKCLEVIAACGHKAPVGWRPFAWGPNEAESTEANPVHYFVFPESEIDVDGEVSAEAICTIPNPVRRPT